MRKFHILFILSAVFAFFSCTNEIEFTGEQQQAMLVLNSFLTPDSVVKVQLTRSKFFLEDDTKFEAIANAEVKLFVNGSFVEKLNYSTNGYYSGSYFPKENDIVKFVAYAPQLAEVNASTNIVPKQLIIGVDSSSVSLGEAPMVQYHSQNGGPYITDTIGFSSTIGLDLRVRFKDEPTVKNYYRLVLKGKSYFEDGQVLESPVNSTTDDLVFGNNSADILGEMSSYSSYNEFSDQLIDGETYELKTRVFYSFVKYKDNSTKPTSPNVGIKTITKQELVVELQSISESYYQYLKSMKANQGGDNFFSEPVQVYSNIVNGIGILGSFTQSSKVFELPATASYDIYYYGSY
jgi:hypothetical protein